jgi:collagenase-like PrtC family protease
MLQLNVPFIPDTDYVQFLDGLGKRLYAVHFSLYDSALCDARIRFETLDVKTLVEHLKRVPAPKKYLLANGRFHPPESYLKPSKLKNLLHRVEQLQTAGVLDGIVFSDPYLLFAISDVAPDLADCIEAVPSVNFMIDSVPKLNSILEMIERSRFRPPGKISVDRALNRRPKALNELSAAIRSRLLETKIELLANEGCLNQCPFRPAHDALIAAANAGFVVDTLRLNRDLGCMRVLSESPHCVLSSPFIRPEDMARYEASADIIKICGRTLGKGFLTQTVGAYIKGKYTGNLLDLFEVDSTSYHFLLRNPTKPSRPVPNKSQLAGTGVVATEDSEAAPTPAIIISPAATSRVTDNKPSRDSRISPGAY